MRRPHNVLTLHIVSGFTGPGKTIRTDRIKKRHAERSVTIEIPVEHLFTGRERAHGYA
ncbi:hypothetical protein ZK67_003656 [Salmonella enterica subsp. enterica serovar Oranienburg]|nr:hypothetical protein [Salmonella enterica subsp. enterica serovar Oranienburg]